MSTKLSASMWARAVCLAGGLLLSGCGAAFLPAAGASDVVTSVLPSATGYPNSLATWGTYEFVSVQGTGQIFSYNLATGQPVLAVQPFSTACAFPSGMAVATVASAPVLAVACYDTGQLLTLSVHGDGSLTALGAVGGLDTPYPGLALDGTNVLVPLFGKSLVRNGGVAKISIAAPSQPVVTGVATLLSPVPGGYANPGALTVSSGYVYVAAGSESAPGGLSSTIQTVDEASMTVVGTPLVVEHSPQQIAVQGTTAFVTDFDAAELIAVDISAPARLQIAGKLPLPNCSALPIVIQSRTAFVGCFGQGTVLSVDVSAPGYMKVMDSKTGLGAPQAFGLVSGKMVVVSSAQGGAMYVFDLAASGLTGSV